MAALPVDRVEPTPYQRDLSQPHVARLSDALDRLGRFLDPIIVVPAEDGRYWTPNGNHRLAALRALGARSVIALVVPEPEVAHRILVLNTEKAHNLRERALEVARLAEALVELAERRTRAERLLELDLAVGEAVKRLKERGFQSPYLRAFVVARINPLRFKRGAKADPDETLAKMLASAERFDAGKVRPDQVASAGGPPDEG